MADKETPERASIVADPARDDNALVVADTAAYAALFHADSPHATLEKVRELVQYVAALIAPRRERYIAPMGGGKEYPMHTYWSVYDMALGVTNDTSPVEAFPIAGKPDVEAYRCRVTLYMPDGKQLGSGEAVCAANEKNPMGGPWLTHALVSKTQTRAFVKAHRLAMSLIPLLDGLEPISYEELVEPPLMFPGDDLDLEKVGEDVQIGLKHLNARLGETRKWGVIKARARLAKFMQTDGTLDEVAAVAFLSAELAKADEEAGR
ncbi:MAG TPA: hypothetical protein VMY37_18210 [Thermoguttaceae bacterium]|nr:hypothetical protein [Thermoguttaceae bacterium]